MMAGRLFSYACERHPSITVVNILLKAGANVEDESPYGRVIHHASDSGSIKTVSLLLEHGASPFSLGRGGLYCHRLPLDVTSNRKIKFLLKEWMQHLFFHLSEEDQSTLLERIFP